VESPACYVMINHGTCGRCAEPAATQWFVALCELVAPWQRQDRPLCRVKPHPARLTLIFVIATATCWGLRLQMKRVKWGTDHHTKEARTLHATHAHGRCITSPCNHIHTCAHARTHAKTHMHACTRANTRTHTHTHTHTHTCTYTRTRIRTHAHKHICT